MFIHPGQCNRIHRGMQPFRIENSISNVLQVGELHWQRNWPLVQAVQNEVLQPCR